jgi:hypothetical protein
MKKPIIDLSNLVTIEDHLKALVMSDDSITHIEHQLSSFIDNDPGWRHRAKHAQEAWKATRRRITARLAVIRQQEKVRNIELNQRHNDLLVRELIAVVPLATFQECDQRARIKAERKQ